MAQKAQVGEPPKLGSLDRLLRLGVASHPARGEDSQALQVVAASAREQLREEDDSLVLPQLLEPGPRLARRRHCRLLKDPA
mmetsp:Transcript_15477/g.33546  ORF Transcript_15477/g.33546 Transcript_15477/m.33546 type:complete len:81 (+) Transcript_15477:1343-1585(+)